jgi:opacity protein-like surface antigen
MKRSLLIATCVVVIPLALAGQAQAVSEVFHEGNLTYVVGHRHTLYEVSARLLSGGGSTNIVCTNALEDSGAVSGQYVCAGTGAGALAVHPFCNCQWRRGLAISYYASIPVNARAREDF